tara:strand:+ start:178 stop:528 length:351 start_codon:yes stop_codon:yes gene_type:complete
MKSIYLKEANSEKLRHKPDRGYITRMHHYADKQNPFTLSVFKDTGRLTPVKLYQTHYPDVELHTECTGVMVYIGGAYIELMKSGRWILHLGGEHIESKDINSLEKKLFDWLKGELK